MPRTRAPGTAPPDAVLDRVTELGRAGLMLQAHEAARAFAPLRQWTGLWPRIIAADLANELGAPLLAMAQWTLAWREARHDPRAANRYWRVIRARRGNLAALEFLDEFQDGLDADPKQRVEALSARASLLSQFRDFERAHACLDEAMALDPHDVSALLTRAQVMDAEDRHADAMKQIEQTLILHPRSLSAIQARAYLLHHEGRDDEAVEVLDNQSLKFESADFASSLALIHSERGDHDSLAKALDDFERLTPLLEPKGRQWVAALRADVAWARGDRRVFADMANRSASPFHMFIASRLDRHEQPGTRVLLPVGFVRQHHMTCVPATLSAISKFWQRPADHVEIADAISYAGTTNQAERSWAESHGWVVREFTVTWEATRALLDRGIPFTLATRQGDTGHTQAVIGYDTARGTLFLRDPTIRHHIEASAEQLLESQAFCGPRGMAIVPAERADLFEGLALPEAELHDHYHGLESALKACARDRAMTELRAIEEAAPGHRLALLARHAMASFDADLSACQETLDRWVERYPNDVTMRIRRLGILEKLSRRAEVRKELQDLMTGPHTHPAYWILYARLLAGDARELDEALRYIHAAIRAQPDSPVAYMAMGELLMNTQRRRSLQLHRLAACLGGTNEAITITYFQAARAAGNESEALAFLESRWRRLGTKSPAPGVTLAMTLVNLGQERRAFELLESTMSAHGENGELMLVVANALQSRGRSEAARVLLRRAEGRCSEASLLEARGRIALQQGDASVARDSWTRIVARDPLSVEGHQALAILDCAESGPTRTLANLEAAVSLAPHHIGLRRLELNWVSLLRPDLLETKSRALVEVSPRDAEARLQLCSTLARDGKTAEVIEQARMALEIAPLDPHCAGAAATILVQEAGRHPDSAHAGSAPAGSVQESARLLLTALAGSVDQPQAIHTLVLMLRVGDDERRETLSLLADEIRRQPGSGAGLRAFARVAEAVWRPEELGAFLDSFLAQRGDMPAAWSAVVFHETRLGDPARALAVAQQAVERFPLQAGAWLDLASARCLMGDQPGEIEALERALHTAPSSRRVVTSLARAYHRSGRTEEMLAQLRRTFPTEPPDEEHEGQVAEMLWGAGCHDEALRLLQHLLRLFPRSERGWGTLAGWSAHFGRDLAAPLARQLTIERPDDPGVWIGLAHALRQPGDSPEVLAAAWRAQDLAPFDIQPRDIEATTLALQGHFDQALIACRPKGWGASPPIQLQGRRAWVLWARGDRMEAAESLRKILSTHPLYGWGWRQLLALSRATGDRATCLEAAQWLAALDVTSAEAHVDLARALLEARRRAEAKSSLGRALKLDPALDMAVSLLFNIQIEDNELKAAADTLRHSARHLSAHAAMAMEVRLLCANRHGDAVEMFRRLCLDPLADWEALSTAADGMNRSGHGLSASGLLEASLHEPVHSPWVLAVWVAMKLIRDDDVVRCMEVLSEPPENGEAWKLAALEFMDRLRQAGRASPFGQFISEHEVRLSECTQTWIVVLETLIEWERFSRARQWVEGWESRGDLTADACWKVSLALRGADDDRAAARAIRVGLERFDGTHAALAAWMAFDAARQGDRVTADRMLDTTRSGRVRRDVAFLAALARGMLAIHADAGVRQWAFGESRRLLREAKRIHPDYRVDTLLRRAFDQAVGTIAARRGGPVAFLWRQCVRQHRTASSPP